MTEFQTAIRFFTLHFHTRYIAPADSNPTSMKINFSRFAFVCFLLCFSVFSKAQNLLINDSNGDLVAFNADDCSTAFSLDISSYTDIATHPNGFLYAVRSSGQLYEIDLTNGTTNEIHDFSGASNYFALTADADGNIFAAAGNGALSSYNPATDTDVFYQNTGFGASGDLTFYQGLMYMATSENTIVSIHPDNPSQNAVFIDFSSSGATIYGIVSSVEGCTVNTYAFSNDNQAKVYQIDWENQSFNFVCTIPHTVYGGASQFEFDASASLIDISEINLINDGCGDALSDVEIIADSDNGGIVYSLDGENFQTENTFTDLAPDNYTVYLEDAGGCSGSEDFIVFSAFAEVTETQVTDASCGNANGVISVTGSTGSGAVGYALDGGAVVQSGTFDGLPTGEYEVTVYDLAECSATVTLTVAEAQIEDLIATEIRNTSCGEANGMVTVTGTFGNGNLIYTLNEETQTAETFENLAAGDYTLSVEDSDGCAVEKTFSVLPSDVLRPEATTVTEATCGQANGTATLSANTTAVLYSTDGINFSENPRFDNLPAGDYTAFYQTGSDCTVSAAFTVPESETSCEVYVPSAFSPNNDGINDIFKPYSETEIMVTDLKIFGRWGQLLYAEKNLSTTDLNAGWDGKTNGTFLKDGVYIYVLNYMKGTENVLMKGDVLLVR